MTDPLSARPPPGPSGCPLRCGAEAPCRFVGECYAGCHRQFVCDDCGATLTREWPPPPAAAPAGEGVGGG